MSRRWSLLVTGAFALALTTACGGVVVLESGDPVRFVEQPQTSRVVASDNSTLADLHTEQDRRRADLEAIPDALVSAVVAVEDRRFFLHQGLDVPAIARAAAVNVQSGEIQQGGSTITQQYVKNTMLEPVRTLERKIKEAALAYQLERRYSKREILQRYLNTIYFGHGAYGVHAAALRYFDRPVGQLNLSQSAMLAGLIASPATYDPYKHPEAARRRRATVLRALVDTGHIDTAEADRAERTSLDLAPLEDEPAVAPYAVAEIKRRIRRDDQRFAALGDTPDARLSRLFTGGLVVHTTIDRRAQRLAERAVNETLGETEPSAALVALDPRSGAVRALIGGRGSPGGTSPIERFNLATQGRRQAGSAFKPITLAAGLSRGVGLDRSFPAGSRVTIDDPTCTGPEGPWTPTNYGGLDYPELTLREATVKSVNTVYARLVADLGPVPVVETAHELGIDGKLDPVCSVALGAEEVSPLDLTGAYQAFANLGVYHEPHLIERIETHDGRVIYEHEDRGQNVLDPSVAYLITQTLTEVVERGTGVRAAIDRPQAGKTGTTDSNADAWFVGYTPHLVAGVWVGFPRGRIPMVPPTTPIRVEGGRWPAEIWSSFAGQLLADTPPRRFEVPDVSLVTVRVDTTRNCLPNPYTPPELIEKRQYLKGTAPTQVCREPTGPAVDDVPEVVGLTRDIATRLLASKGFNVEERPVASPRYPPGYVTDQRPAPGDPITQGDAVVIHVSTHSRERVPAPDVTGLTVDAARSRLESDDWVVEVTEEAPDCPSPASSTPPSDGAASASPRGADEQPGCAFPPPEPGTVHRQTPRGGERIEPHSIITLYVIPEQE